MPKIVDDHDWNFQNSYLELPSKFYIEQSPTEVENPRIVCFNSNLALDLGLDFLLQDKDDATQVLSGNKIPKGGMPISQAYAGHQFGNFTMLGDGRAILLGEQIDPKNNRYDVQLKGAGKTPFSRNGDGRATLSSMLREYLISESMYYLNIPTSRSLAVIETDESIYRETINNGAILTRIASSHIRVGTFEYVINYCSKSDLDQFIKYVINRHFLEIKDADNIVFELLKTIMEKQISLIVDWSRVGFIHGVMNTDNMSIAGETIDYGPCAFMNIYDPETVYSSIDRYGRYSFGNQPKIAHWNLSVLAGTLLSFFSTNKEEAIKLAKELLNTFSTRYYDKWYKMMFKKLGFIKFSNKDKDFVDILLHLMKKYKADYNNTFAALTIGREVKNDLFDSSDFLDWKSQWENRINYKDNFIKITKLMKSQNPLFIPRNHLVESALEDAVNGNMNNFNYLLELMSKTYNYIDFNNDFQTVPVGFDEQYKTYCGT